MEGSECGTVGHPAVNRESSTTTTCFPSMVAKDRIDPSTSGRNFGRVCVSCHTSKTPLWRGGPKGPKSLCNACVIKYRKARRALAAAAAGTDSVGCSRQRNPPFHLLDDQQDLDTKPIKKQYYRDTAVKYAGRGRPKKLSRISTYSAQCADFIDARDHQNKMLSNSIGLSKSPAPFHPVFPKDEEEAAMLLLALSGGLVYL